MKIVSWNVAGLRACLNKGLDRFVSEDKADIYCFQETKITEEENPFHPLGYREYSIDELILLLEDMALSFENNQFVMDMV